jgi:hypothetical protein
MSNLQNIKIMKTIVLLILSIGLFAFSCENQSPVDMDIEAQNNVSALIVYEGDPAVDGCGWLIQRGQNFYSPVNLDSDFKTDSLKVVVSYKILESSWNCGWREPGYKQIEILNIKKQ